MEDNNKEVVPKVEKVRYLRFETCYLSLSLSLSLSLFLKGSVNSKIVSVSLTER